MNINVSLNLENVVSANQPFSPDSQGNYEIKLVFENGGTLTVSQGLPELYQPVRDYLSANFSHMNGVWKRVK